MTEGEGAPGPEPSPGVSRPEARPPLVLASASPRRAALLDVLGLAHEVLPADVPESVEAGETPEAHVDRLARAKALAVARLRPDALVLGGDTVVALDGEILGKPADEAEALAMLLRLAGRAHTVHSGLALALPGDGLHSAVSSTRVEFRPFDEAVARAYVASGEPMDKAGAYGIQGRGAALVRRVEGDYSGVVGLPVATLVDLLEAAGWAWIFTRRD